MGRFKADYWTLYKATFPNRKVYIGITSQTLKARIQQHKWKRAASLKLPMYRALKKYKDSVVWETILTFDKKEHAIAAEISFIDFYNSTTPDKGYNLTRGGQGCSGLKRLSQRIQLIDNCGNIFLGYEEACKHYNLSESQILQSVNKNFYCGLIYFSKYQKGMTKAHPRKFNRIHRKIVDETNGIVFFSLKDASKFHEISSKLIQRVCYGERDSTNKIKFSYLDKKEA